MRKSIRLVGDICIIAILIIFAGQTVSAANTDRQWVFPFSMGTTLESAGDTLTFEQILQKVSQENGTLQSVEYLREGIPGLIKQSQLRINPELAFEVEDFSGNLPGLSQTEWSLSLSQELELWGKRSARIEAARVESLALASEIAIIEFDIYIDVKRHYAELLNAQTLAALLERGHELANEMVEAARRQVKMGAALAAELYLAELEASRLKMELNASQTDLLVAKASLAALWGGDPVTFKAVQHVDFEMAAIDPAEFNDLVEGSREILELGFELSRIEAKTEVTRVENRLNPTLTAGYKRQEAHKVNTFLFGVSLPLPLFNRNQGKLAELHSNRLGQQSQIEQKHREIKAAVIIAYQRLYQLHERLSGLDESLIPKATSAYQIIKETYDRGRLRYTELLEAERILMELERERSVTRLECIYQMIEIEKTLGIKLDNPYPEEVRP
ncbi:MAG: TolC family protein [FCB group bacterium]|nr:TolC family protein [FCB group bacterium]